MCTYEAILSLIDGKNCFGIALPTVSHTPESGSEPPALPRCSLRWVPGCRSPVVPSTALPCLGCLVSPHVFTHVPPSFLLWFGFLVCPGRRVPFLQWSCPLIPAVGQPFSAQPPPLAKVTCSGQTSPIRQPRHGYSPSRGRAREAGSSSFPSGADSLASDQTLLTNKM